MHFQILLSLLLKVPRMSYQVHFSGESCGLISMVMGPVNDCHSDVSPVNNSDLDSGVFGYFL